MLFVNIECMKTGLSKCDVTHWKRFISVSNEIKSVQSFFYDMETIMLESVNVSSDWSESLFL